MDQPQLYKLGPVKLKQRIGSDTRILDQVLIEYVTNSITLEALQKDMLSVMSENLTIAKPTHLTINNNQDTNVVAPINNFASLQQELRQAIYDLEEANRTVVRKSSR